jgi:tripartite-type tricarboxylate transporter receptor subunit TctC
MSLARRHFLCSAVMIALLSSPRVALAQIYPAKPVRIVVGYPPGGPGDISARLIAHLLSTRLGAQVVVENRTGGGGNIANEAVVRAPPDGYTLMLMGIAQVVNASLYQRSDLLRGIAPVAAFSREPIILVVNPSLPARTVPELIAYARGRAGGLNMASAGIGTPAHIAGELFQMMTGIRMHHIPYRGGAPALTDLIAGQVDVFFAAMSASVEYVRAGKLRPLAVTTRSPSDALPEVPTVASFVPGFEVSLWTGLGAPRDTPVEIINKLNKEINAGLADPAMRERLADIGSTPLTGSPADFGMLIADEAEKWAKVIASGNIKAE